MPLIAAHNLRVTRGDSLVLDIPHFTIDEGETLALLGPNGAGKTTFLLTLARLLKYARGEILFKGQDISRPEFTVPYRRRLAMVFQEPLLLNTTVYNNVAAGLNIRGMHKEEIKKRVSRYAELVKITHLLKRDARKLSGGEAQRANLARAFATEPEMILLDEPFANLDAPSRDSLIDDLQGILSETKTASILATHDRMEALRLADRMAVMDGGRIVQIGPCSDVMNHPANEMVASFVGMETVFSGRVQTVSDGSFVLSVAGHAIEAIGRVYVGEEVICCIRPENIIISQERAIGGTSVRNNLPATIVKIISQGPFFKIHLDCGFFLAGYVTQQSLEQLSLEAGRKVVVSFKATAVHVIRRGS